jgi:hypothetical protein
MRFNKICDDVEPGTGPGEQPGTGPGQTPAVEGNLLGNGDFSSGDAEWTFLALSPAEGAQSVSDGKCRIAVATPDVFWKVQLYQGNLSLVQGRTYTVSFDALSDEAGKEISVDIKVENGEGGYWKTLTLTTSMSTFSESFVYDGQTTGEARLKFHVGKSAGDVVFDNVSLVEGGDAPVVQGLHACRPGGVVRMATSGGRVTRLVVAPGIGGRVSCGLFDGRGRRLVSRTAGAGAVLIDDETLARLPAGAYLVRFTHGMDTHAMRIMAGNR